MKQINKQNAVVYCRVSDPKQTVNGHGLASQETRCREYAGYNGYTTKEVFHDDMTGGLAERPGIHAMVEFLNSRRDEQWTVIIDDITRWARDVEAHWALRHMVNATGAKLESPTLKFGEDADSIMLENLLATMSQHHRQKNAEQTKNRMRARTQNGYWVFQAPVGYRYKKVRGEGSVLVRDEPAATVITEALEGYASGRFDTQAEVKRFLEAHPCIPKTKAGYIRNQQVKDILTRVVYAGYIEVPNWGVTLREAKHDGFISFETHRKIQNRLQGKAKVPARKDINLDFPLRGFVTCGCCNTPLTAYWAKGRSQRYPYYQCPKKGCEVYGKPIKREMLEQEFADLLQDMKPSRELFELALDLFKHWWDDQENNAAQQAKATRKELTKIETKVEQFMERVVEADSPALITAYEQQITRLEERKAELSESIKKCGRPLHDFDGTFRTAFEFLGNPQKLWHSDRLEERRLVLKMAFADRLPYVRNEGFRTAPIALPFRVLQQLDDPNCKMARHLYLEPLRRPIGGAASASPPLSSGRPRPDGSGRRHVLRSLRDRSPAGRSHAVRSARYAGRSCPQSPEDKGRATGPPL